MTIFVIFSLVSVSIKKVGDGKRINKIKYLYRMFLAP